MLLKNASVSQIVRRYATTIATPNIYTTVGASSPKHGAASSGTTPSEAHKDGFHSVKTVRINMNSLIEDFHNQETAKTAALASQPQSHHHKKSL